MLSKESKHCIVLKIPSTWSVQISVRIYFHELKNIHFARIYFRQTDQIRCLNKSQMNLKWMTVLRAKKTHYIAFKWWEQKRKIKRRFPFPFATFQSIYFRQYGRDLRKFVHLRYKKYSPMLFFRLHNTCIKISILLVSTFFLKKELVKKKIT